MSWRGHAASGPAAAAPRNARRCAGRWRRTRKLEVLFFIGRNLSKRLQVEIGCRRVVTESEQPFLIVQACFFERPAYSEVSHQALSDGRHPSECTDPNAHQSFLCA